LSSNFIITYKSFKFYLGWKELSIFLM
jgi:hypothetical protein